MKKVTTLASAFRAELRERGWSLATLAELAIVPASTLRTCMSRNAFPRDLAVRVAGLLGMDPNPRKLERRFLTYGRRRGCWALARARGQAGPKTLLGVFEETDRAAKKIGKFIAAHSHWLVATYETMGPGSLFALFSSSVSPVEFEKHLAAEMLPAIAGALCRGALFVYFRAGESVIHDYDAEWKIPRVLDRGQVEREFADFRSNITRYLVEVMDKSEGQAAEIVDRGLHQFFCDRCLFWAPGFSFAMFQEAAAAARVTRRITVRLPGNFGGVFFMPHDHLFEYRFERCVTAALSENQHRIDSEMEKLAADCGDAALAELARQQHAIETVRLAAESAFALV